MRRDDEPIDITPLTRRLPARRSGRAAARPNRRFIVVGGNDSALPPSTIFSENVDATGVAEMGVRKIFAKSSDSA
ncbi:MAG: hypothetical protein H7Z39_12860 [Burkholderiaceae bacterium]|nr:hypothetical protein [Burkholderiaceae bacterium]